MKRKLQAFENSRQVLRTKQGQALPGDNSLWGWGLDKTIPRLTSWGRERLQAADIMDFPLEKPPPPTARKARGTNTFNTERGRGRSSCSWLSDGRRHEVGCGWGCCTGWGRHCAVAGCHCSPTRGLRPSPPASPLLVSIPHSVEVCPCQSLVRTRAWVSPVIMSTKQEIKTRWLSQQFLISELFLQVKDNRIYIKKKLNQITFFKFCENLTIYRGIIRELLGSVLGILL